MAKRIKQRRAEVPEKYFDPKENKFLVYEIYRRSRKTIYHLRGGQDKFASQITLSGFQGLPSGLFLNRSGYGFGKKGVFLLSVLAANFAGGRRKLNLVITDKDKKAITQGSSETTVVLSHTDVRTLLTRLGRINEDNNNELRSAVASFLSTKFPKRLKIAAGTFDDYQSGEVAALLRRNNVAKKLNEDDLLALKGFLPALLRAPSKGKRRIYRIQREALIRSTRAATDKIFLDEVIAEFEANLRKKTLSEGRWQDFLREKVFRFLSNYVTSIEKQNVSLGVSYPDFVLVDVYGFVDVFEIKRHDTPLLAFDESHENFYWKSEVAQAISQIENYIDEVIHNSDDFARQIKRKKHLEIKVVRPRGFIIAGTSKQFRVAKESEDFRMLGTALKNISFILYDELLANLKNLRAKL